MGNLLDWLKQNVAVLKDIFTSLREVILVICLILLLIFPEGFNSILTRAGFVEADFGFIKWKRQIEQMQQDTMAADSLLTQMEAALQTTGEVLDQRTRSLDGEMQTQEFSLASQNIDSTLANSRTIRQKLKENLESQQALLNDIQKESR